MFGLFLFLAVVLSFSVQFAFAERMGCRVRVIPEQPTELDEVKVAVNFLFYTYPPRVADFGIVRRAGNTFSVDVVVDVPAKDQCVLQVVHNDSNVYRLGRLEAGEYTFIVYVQTVNGSSQYWLVEEVKFTVSPATPPHTPEISNVSYILILLALTSVATVLLKVSKRKKQTKLL